MTTAQVARALAVSRQTIARWVRDNRIKAMRLPSGLIRIARAEVERIKNGT